MTTGIALSGGGLKCIAHIGALKALEELNVKFDYISGRRVNDVQAAIAENVVESSNRLGGKLICAATISGKTAAVISNLKPEAPVLALCPDEKTGRRLALNWGVYPVELKVCNS